MSNDDFDIARKILQGAWSPQGQRSTARPSTVPASFREIDGRELARQYVTHRKIAVGAHGAGAPREPGSELGAWARDLHARIVPSR